MMNTRRWRALTLAMMLVGACDQSDGSDDSATCEGAKCDDGNSRAPSRCPSADEMVDLARRALVDEEPDFFSLDDFHDGTRVEALDDLDGDGVADALVFPGISYAGPNVEQAVFLTGGDACPNTYVGHFGASEVSAADSGDANGVRDLRVVNMSACEAEIAIYSFDGDRYLEKSKTTENVCEEQCMTEGELLDAARRQLVADEPDFYDPADFRDEIAVVTTIEDLNGDGIEEARVEPGISYAGANVEITIFLSQDGCPSSYAGHFGAVDVGPAESGESNGVRDVVASNVSNCEAELTTYAYDGERYQSKSVETETVCGG